jgi:benzodiazapine receptor
MNKDLLRQIVTIAALVLTLIVNWAANALPLNGVTTAQISDSIPSYFTPAGYVFAIWGVIYLGLIAFTVYQALPSQRENPRFRAIGWGFVFSCIANSLWIFAWHYGYFALSILIMGALLLFLLGIYERLGTGRAPSPTWQEFWFARVPFSLYLGWITVATIANASSVLFTSRWNGFGIGYSGWTFVMLGVAVLLGAVVAWLTRDRIYIGVLLWAFVGIALKQAEVEPSVATAAWIAAAVTAVALVVAPMLTPKPPSNGNGNGLSVQSLQGL